MYGFIIEVTGNVLFEDGIQIVQDIVCGGSAHDNPIFKCDYVYDPDVRLVEGDIIFDKKHRAIPYAAYLVHGHVASSSNSNKIPGVNNYFEESIYDIKKLLEKSVDADIRCVLYKQLYLDVFSAIELYLSEYVLMRIYTNDSCYQRATDYWKTKSKIKNCGTLSPSEIERRTNNFIFKMVYHQFDKIDDLYYNVLGVRLPDYSRLKNALYKRHDIIHRGSISGYDRMTVVEIRKEDVITLIEVVERFYKELNDLSLCLIN